MGQGTALLVAVSVFSTLAASLALYEVWKMARPSSRALRRERLAWLAMYGGITASQDDVEPGVAPEVRDVWLRDCVTDTMKNLLPLMLDYNTAKPKEAEVALLIRMPVSEVAHDHNPPTLGPIEFGVSRIAGQVPLTTQDAIA